jgi:hypothetical protein
VPFASLAALVALAKEYIADHRAARPARVQPARKGAHSEVASSSGETLAEL